jgi:hypothetical protein
VDRKHYDGNANEELPDEALIRREESEHREYMRLEDKEPHLRDTNYRELKGSIALISAWERWWKTTIVARARGLFPKRR